MVDVAQWLEHWIVVPGVVGSIPIFHPRNRPCISLVGFFVSIAAYRLVGVTQYRVVFAIVMSGVYIKKGVRPKSRCRTPFVCSMIMLALRLFFAFLAGYIRLPYHAFVDSPIEKLNLFIAPFARAAQ